MSTEQSNSEIIHNSLARWLPYAAILNPTITNGNLTFTTAEDPLGFIPSGLPYPIGGKNLGIINRSVRIKKGADLQDLPASGTGSVADKRFYRAYKRVVEFELLSSGRKDIVDIFDDPGFRSDNSSDGGGESEAPGHVLVNMYADLHHEDVFLAYIHWDVTALPADEELGGENPSTIKAVFNCYAGVNPNNSACLRPPGSQIWRRLYINSAGSSINPDNPDIPMDNNANNDAYPAINMVGGMIGM